VVLHRVQPGSSSDEAKSTAPTETHPPPGCQKFDPERLLDGFQQATEGLLSVIQSDSSFRRPVTVAIDITTIRYFGNVEGMPMVSGTKDAEGRAFKFATLSIVGWNIPLILAVEPIRESSSWDETHRIGFTASSDGLFDAHRSTSRLRWCCATESLTRKRCTRRSRTSM